MRPVAIVTGGSSNIGWACVQRFAQDHRVVIADLRPPADPLPAHVEFVGTDVTDRQACLDLMSHASGMGAVTALVHSAAITAPARSIEEIDVTEWRRLIDVNLTGAFLVAQAGIPALRASQGCMVMISSRACLSSRDPGDRQAILAPLPVAVPPEALDGPIRERLPVERAHGAHRETHFLGRGG